MKTYRTVEQFETIVNNCENGNWGDAAQNCVDFGFYAQDLINKQNEYDFTGIGFADLSDIALVAEQAQKLRN